MEALGVAMAVGFVYALTLSGNHSETEDSVSFAVRVRDDAAADLLEGAHLVYLAIGRVLYDVARAVGLTDDPLLALQAFDLVLGAATVAALWLLLRHVGATAPEAALGAGTVAFSYAFWRNAVEPEVYALSGLALVVSLGAAWVATRTPGARNFAFFGLATGVAVLAHVTNVLFVGVAVAALILAARPHGRRAAPLLRWGGAYASAAALIVLPAYGVAAAVNGLESRSEFWRWFTERSGQPGDFGTIGFSNLPQGLVGSGRALVGGHFALSIESIREFMTARFPGKTFSEEVFFLEGFPAALALALLVVSVLTASLVCLLAVRRLRRPILDPAKRALAVLAATWLATYLAFFLWWDPLNIELWYAVWVPAAVLLSFTAAQRRSTVLVAAVVGGLFLANLVGSMLPQRSEARDLWRTKASWYRSNAQPDDLVVSNGYVWSSYLRYLVDAQVVDIEDFFREAETPQEALARLRSRMESARGRVLVSGEAFHPFAERRIACLDASRTCAIAAVTSRELRRECVLVAVTEDPLERVWRCRLPA